MVSLSNHARFAFESSWRRPRTPNAEPAGLAEQGPLPAISASSALIGVTLPLSIASSTPSSFVLGLAASWVTSGLRATDGPSTRNEGPGTARPRLQPQQIVEPLLLPVEIHASPVDDEVMTAIGIWAAR